MIIQPGRRATGDQLVYTASDDKFVLTGGSPSIFDAEQGKITGVSLTLFRHDDRVVVEGNNTSPTVTQTREWHVKCVPWPQTKSANPTVVDGL